MVWEVVAQQRDLDTTMVKLRMVLEVDTNRDIKPNKVGDTVANKVATNNSHINNHNTEITNRVATARQVDMVHKIHMTNLVTQLHLINKVIPQVTVKIILVTLREAMALPK